MNNKTGREIIDFANSLLGNETLDDTMALQMINVIRGVYEMKRPWQVLKKYDASQTISPSNTYNTPLTIPEDFRMYLEDYGVQLFDGTNIPQQTSQFPYEQKLLRKNNAFEWCADYGSYQFYIMGIIPSIYTVYQWYIFNPGDIEIDTTWLRFPGEYHFILSYELAAMWRLGTDWDDVNARNADDNARRADMIFKSMETWDAKLAGAAVKNIEYPQNRQGKNMGNTRFWGPRGTLRQ